MEETETFDKILKEDLEIIKKIKRENKKLRRTNTKLRSQLVNILKKLKEDKKGGDDDYNYDFSMGWLNDIEMEAEKIKEIDPGRVDEQIEQLSKFIEDI